MRHPPARKEIVRRGSADTSATLLPGLPALLQRVYRARKVLSAEELDRTLAKLPSPWELSGMETIVAELIEVIEQQKHLLIVADFDADGATSCAVGLLGLRAMGAQKLSYLVPNRFDFGYGLTPEIVEVAAQRRPHVLLTVDNGISSIDGVRAAKALGLKVLITDHHLPGHELPAADAIVNPNLTDDRFPSKSLAGVGVMFYVLMALRGRLRERGHFAKQGIAEPNLGQLLDLVALGTVADVVALDRVNRILVHQGLQRIRSGQCRPGIAALLEIAGRKPAAATTTDLGFAAGPRLNAAGRLEDMSLGIACLLSTEPEHARTIAAELDALNRDRRSIEEQMTRDALSLLDRLPPAAAREHHSGYCLFDPDWHQGVIGILASRMKDRLLSPVIAFAPAGEGLLKGSARSVPGVHIRDVLAEIAAEHPELLSRFGGHAMAAGLSLAADDLATFSQLFDDKVALRIGDGGAARELQSDGELEADEIRLDNAELLAQAGPWGQGFPEPLFDGAFDVVQSRIVGEKHLKLVLQRPGHTRLIDGIAFFVDHPEQWLGCRRVHAAYRLDVNEFRDIRSVQLRIEYMEADP